MAYIYLAIAFTINAIANVLLKFGSTKGLVIDWHSPVLMIRENYFFILGIIFFAINVIFYFLALRSIPLSVAYPVMVVMSFIIINASAIWLMGEKISAWQWLGYVLIAAGIVLVYSFAYKK